MTVPETAIWQPFGKILGFETNLTVLTNASVFWALETSVVWFL